jgi:magnesium chelatase family protein
MTPRYLFEHCRISAKAQASLVEAISTHALSARAHDRILKLARTRADLEGHADIRDEDIAVAIECRQVDRKEWKQRPVGDMPAYNSTEQRQMTHYRGTDNEEA